jgi:hypothetical protein
MDLMNIALMLVRLVGAIFVTLGLAWLVLAVPFFIIGAGPLKYYEALLDPMVTSLVSYGFIDLASGFVIILFSRRIARFGSRLS